MSLFYLIVSISVKEIQIYGSIYNYVGVELYLHWGCFLLVYAVWNWLWASDAGSYLGVVRLVPIKTLHTFMFVLILLDEMVSSWTSFINKALLAFYRGTSYDYPHPYQKHLYGLWIQIVTVCSTKYKQCPKGSIKPILHALIQVSSVLQGASLILKSPFSNFYCTF